MPRKTYHIAWRWIALISLLAHISFGYFYQEILPNAKTMREVTSSYPSFFSPAPYTFAIWGVIYLSLIIYSIFSLLPSNKLDLVYDTLAKPFAFANFMATCWILSFVEDEIVVSMLFIMLLLGSAIILYLRSKEAILREQISTWVSVPFSLLLSWICVATIANFEIVVTSIGWHNTILGDAAVNILLLTGTMALGIWVSSTYKDFIFPLVISWASFGISVGQKFANREVSMSAFIIGVILVLWTVGFASWMYSRKRPKLSMQ